MALLPHMIACVKKPFSLLLTDIVMPEMDGIELARRATEIDPDLKVMFITGFAAVALRADSEAPKDAKVLSKPFHLRDLVNEVEKMLGSSLVFQTLFPKTTFLLCTTEQLCITDIVIQGRRNKWEFWLLFRLSLQLRCSLSLFS